MKAFVCIIGMVAALVMCGVSGAMNYLFLSSLGKTPLEGEVLGAASAAADVLKALLPFFIAWNWQSRRFVAAVAGTLAFVYFAVFSLASAIGFAAGNRMALVESGDRISQSYEGLHAEQQRLEGVRARLPAHRPVGIVREALEGQKQNNRWHATRGCTDATEPASREYCTAYFSLRAELAAAEEADRLTIKLAGLQTEAKALRAQGAGQDSDPQTSLLSRITGQEPEPVRLALTIAVALLVEIGASLGLFLASGYNVPVRVQPSDATAEAPDVPKVGWVEDFCLEALIPLKGAALSMSELLDAYREWCAGHAVLPLDAAEFAATFEALAGAIGLPRDAGGYRGIAIAPAQKQRYAA